jgi:serine/threonine protein kinase
MTEKRQFGPYTLVKKIASGGMAEIYLAQTQGIEGFQKQLVLKMIHPKWSQDQSFVSMLISEAKLAVHLNHANIAQIFDLGQTDGQYYIAMEFVDGKDLFQLLVRTSELDSYLPFDVAAHITEQVAAALHYAHDRRDAQGRNLQLIHRDVSPQNLIVSVHGEVKLIDFGIAKATERPGNTQIGIIKGKFYYMSPEQAWGRPLDRRTDIFSLGICLHEMLTGQMLYADDDQMRLLEKVRAADVPRPSDLRPGVPPELDTICMRALSRDADKRFQTGFDFQRALAEYLHRHAAGFTPQRVARMMYDLFPDSYKAAASGERQMSNSDFAQVRPPESVIFDIGRVASGSLPTGAPKAGIPAPTVNLKDMQGAPVPRSRRQPTRPVPALPDASGDAMFGDGLPQSYDPAGTSHPPPPLSDAAPPGGKMPQDSTKIVDWNAFRQRHPERSPDSPAPSAGSGLRRAPSGPSSSPTNEKTTMFSPDAVGQALSGPPSSSGLRRKAPSAPAEAEPFDRTTMFTPPGPGEAAPAERTTMFEPGKAILQGMPGQADPPSNGAGPGEAMPHERTMMFDPAAAGFLNPQPEVDDDDPPTMPFTPLPEVVKDLQKGRSRQSSSQKEAQADAPKKSDSSQADMAARVKAAKAKKAAKASGGGASQSDLAAKVKAAKAKKAAQAAGGGGDDMAARVKAAKAKKAAEAAAGGDAPSGGDDLSAQKKAARAKAKRRAGKGPEVGAPKRAAAKGNARSNVRIAGQTKVFGVIDPASGTGRFLKRALPVLLVLFAFGFIAICSAGFVVFQKLNVEDGPQYGTIIINSNPSGAKVFIDGTPLDAKTPYVLANAEVNRGYDVRLELDNFKPFRQRDAQVNEAKQAVDVNAQLTRVDGTLDILTNVNATVKFGGEERCLSQKRCQITPIAWLPGGFVEITVEAEGHRTEELVLQWPKDDERGFGPTFQHEVTLQPN